MNSIDTRSSARAEDVSAQLREQSGDDKIIKFPARETEARPVPPMPPSKPPGPQRAA
ncbi:hypothetical protein [Sphingopyxis sp. RIFCSPHIGHO2_12_FULL_65_19]|uniref:hypothetical protein n=1 Tax=Sphingopyxis sp. RIFCSPHIGHO2_12_FULL_65_19 TaxID=1802172 RepID=UPI0025D75654|nr:hypothetical protein [Sphingopyxis sp. RIFCSPHIGHO2_12_FULL_65_19]